MMSALKISVLLMARRSVLASVRESGDQELDPSAEMVSKQETSDECINSFYPLGAAQIFKPFDY